jgi:hypothetical protein
VLVFLIRLLGFVLLLVFVVNADVLLPLGLRHSGSPFGPYLSFQDIIAVVNRVACVDSLPGSQYAGWCSGIASVELVSDTST